MTRDQVPCLWLMYIIYSTLLWYSNWTSLGGEDQSCSVAPFCSEYVFLVRCGPTPALLLIFLWVELLELSGQAWWPSKPYASTSATKCTQSRSGSTCRRRNPSDAQKKGCGSREVPYLDLNATQLAWREHGTLCFLKQWMLHLQVFHQRSPVPHTSIDNRGVQLTGDHQVSQSSHSINSQLTKLFGASSRFWVYFPCIGKQQP